VRYHIAMADAKLPPYVRLEIKQGDDTTIRAEYSDDTGAAINLADYEVEFSLVPRNAATPALTIVRTDPEITVDDALGLILVTITAAMTRQFGTAADLVGELTVTSPLPTARRTTLADFLITLRREAVDESAP
jgi:hypothetical protein